MTATIETTRKQNVGQAVIDHLTQLGVYGRVEVKQIHTERNCSTRTKTTTVEYSPKIIN